MKRRDFLQKAFSLSAAAAALGKGLGLADDREAARVESLGAKDAKARIIHARDPKARIEGERFDAGRVAALLDRALIRLTNANDAAGAWKALFLPKDVVGLKLNCLAGPRLSTHPVVVEAIIRGLRLAGVPDNQIFVWERSDKELLRAGFTIQTASSGVRCLGVNGQYDREITASGAVGSCFSPFVSRVCTAHINVPVLKDHLLAGVGAGMKNFYGAIHNPNKYHATQCDPFVADVNNCPLIRNRLRLVVCDALNAQYDGGPTLKPACLWEENALLLGVDPVALDTIAWGMIEERRAAAGLKTLAQSGREPKWLKTANGYGLGENDPGRIEVVRS